MKHLSGITKVHAMNHGPHGLTLRTVDYVLICYLGPIYTFNPSINLILEI